MRNLYIYILALVSLMSCTSEDDIHAEMGEPWYVLQDGPEGSADHYVYNFQKENGVTILFNPQERDYRYNFEKVNNIRIVPCPQEEEVKLKGIEVLRRILIDHYPQDFRKHFFPYLLIPADTVMKLGSSEEAVSYFIASNFLAVDGINGTDRTEEELADLEFNINLKFWVDFIPQMHKGWQLPLDFLVPDMQDYYASEPARRRPSASEAEAMKAEAIQRALKAGVIPAYSRLEQDWDTGKYYYKAYIDRTSAYGTVNKKKLDLMQFYSLPLKKTPEEIAEYLNGKDMEVVKKRYEALMQGVEAFFHFDLNGFSKE